MCWHKYNKWSDVVESYGGSLHQFRACQKCNKIKRRLVVHIMISQICHAAVNRVLKGGKE